MAIIGWLPRFIGGTRLSTAQLAEIYVTPTNCWELKFHDKRPIRPRKGLHMSERAKYIVVEIFCGTMKMETPILFPPHVGHNDMTRSLSITPDDVLAAGFVEFSTVEHLHCGLPFHVVEARAYGESTSLKVKSREVDSRLICQAMKIGDYDL